MGDWSIFLLGDLSSAFFANDSNVGIVGIISGLGTLTGVKALSGLDGVEVTELDGELLDLAGETDTFFISAKYGLGRD